MSPDPLSLASRPEAAPSATPSPRDLRDLDDTPIDCPPVTWAELVALEPYLEVILSMARQVRPDGPYFCANGLYLREFKPEINRVVGWQSHHPYDSLLASSRAWYKVVETIRNALPPCRSCICFVLENESC